MVIIGCLLAMSSCCRSDAPAPERLVFLRGIIAFAGGDMPTAEDNLREAARVHGEEWRVQMLYGQVLVQMKRSAWARAQFRRAVLLAPTRPEPWLGMAQAAHDLNDSALEITALSGLLRILPDNPRLEQQLAAAYRAAGRGDDAAKMDASWQATLPPLRLEAKYTTNQHTASLAELRALRQTDPKNGLLLGALAGEEWRAGNVDAAREVLQQQYRLYTRDVVVIGNVVHLQLRTGHVEEALAALQAAAPLGDYALDHALALWSIAQGNYRDAVEPIQRLLLRNPVDALLNRQLGVAALLAGNSDTALPALRLSWLKEPDDVTAQAYATALLAAGRVVDAEELLKRAIGQFPDDAMLKVILSLLYRDTDRLVQAADLLATVARKENIGVELYQLAAERYLNNNNTQRAYAMASALRDNYPEDVVAARAAVEIFRRLNAFAEARLVLARYLGPNMDSPLTWEQLMLEIARYAAEDNRMAEADAALDEILKRNYASHDAYMQQSRLFAHQGLWRDVMRLNAKALLCWHDDVGFLLDQARAARHVGNYPLALQNLRRATTLTTSAEPWLELADLYQLQNDNPQARECWQTAEGLPDGAIRAGVSLMASYLHAGDAAQSTTYLKTTLERLLAARTARTALWRKALGVLGYTASDEEINALLLLEPDLVDPAPLLARQSVTLP